MRNPSKIKCILIERNEKRELISIDELKILKHFWSIDCVSYTSADSLIKEVKSSNTSALVLLNTIFGKEDSKINHIDNLLCIQKSSKVIEKLIGDNFQVNSIKIIPEQRRLDLRWTLTTDKIWEEIKVFDDEYSLNRNSKCFVQLKDIEIDNSVSQIAINSSNALFILKNSELNKYLGSLIERLPNKSQEDIITLSLIVSLINSFFYYKEFDRKTVEELIERKIDKSKNRGLEKIVWERVDKEELISTILKTNFVRYDNTIWFRRGDFY